MITAGAAFSFHRRCIGPTGSAAIPLGIVAHRSLADKPSLAKIHRCPLFPKSRHSALRMATGSIDLTEKPVTQQAVPALSANKSKKLKMKF